MGEARKDALRLNFNRKLKLEFHGTKVTSDAGLLAYRELDEALDLATMIDADFWAFLKEMLAEFTVRGVEIEPHIVLL